MATRARRPLERPAAFWDASALVPLYVLQESTPQARDWYKSYKVVTWWATPVEVASALTRLLRIRQLDPAHWRETVKSVNQWAVTWSVVEPSDAVRTRAIELVQRYDLRAGDSLQLSAALEWCDHTPQGCRFLTADNKLRDAAMLNGFET